MARKKRKPATMPDMMSLSPGELYALEMTGFALRMMASKNPADATAYEMSATRAGHKAAMALADYAMKTQPQKDKP